MRLSKRILATCLAIFFGSLIFFLINIQFPRNLNFDEFHYIPSAKQFLALQPNQNLEHPPLAKMLIAASVGIFGDRPLGWRFGSVLFGSLTLVGMFLWGLALFKDWKLGLYVAGITLFNQLLYVQSRIAMLDTFMMAFMAWAMAAFTAAWDSKLKKDQVLTYFTAAGAFFGLAIACKWTAIVLWVGCLGLIVLIRLLQYWKTTFRGLRPKAGGDEDWYTPRLWKGVTWRQIALRLVALPLLCYFVTFLPFLLLDRQPRYTLWDLVKMQAEMYDAQLRVVNDHPYMSKWTSWALMIRPIWYAFDRETLQGKDYVRGVVLLGNPLIMWGGLLALLGCVWTWVTRRSRQAFLVLFAYCVLYFSWAVIPRKVSFYFYYYPAAMILSLAIPLIFHHWEKGKLFRRAYWARWAFLAAAFGFFVYFFPILSALRIRAERYSGWMWFSRWI